VYPIIVLKLFVFGFVLLIIKLSEEAPFKWFRFYFLSLQHFNLYELITGLFGKITGTIRL